MDILGDLPSKKGRPVDTFVRSGYETRLYFSLPIWEVLLSYTEISFEWKKEFCNDVLWCVREP